MNIHYQTLSTFQNRETNLESDNIEYINALATTQRTLEEKARTLESILNEKRWLQTDLQMVNEQLNNYKNRIENDSKSYQETIGGLKNKLQIQTNKIDELTKSLSEQMNINNIQLNKLNEYEIKKLNDTNNNIEIRMSESDQRFKTMADHLIQKSSQIERLSSERSTYKYQYESECTRVSVLESQLKRLKEKLHRNEEIDEIDLEHGSGQEQKRLHLNSKNYQNLVLQSPTSVIRAVNLLDSFSATAVFILRRHPNVRISFAVYVLILHLWVMFVLNHFMNEVR
jgi:chromosome segregation ATPase